MARSSERSQSLGARRARKLFYGVNILTALLLSLVLWYMVNFIASRHHVRWDVSASGYFTLSERSVEVIDALGEPLVVVAFVSPEHVLYSDVWHLLNEYDAASRDVSVQWVDPDRDLEEASALLARHRLAKKESVLFLSGTSMRSVSLDGLKEKDSKQEGLYRARGRVRFSGEQWFTSAIYSLGKKDQGTVYFLEGHGEKSLRRTDSVGYSMLARLLEREYLEVKTFHFGDELALPDDCDLLVVPGASRRISQPELARLGAYLEGNGRALFLLDSLMETGLEDLLEGWGVAIGDDLVVDRSRSFSGSEVYVREYGGHVITEPLQGVYTAFYTPRSVGAVALSSSVAQDRPSVVTLISCTSNGWAEVDTDIAPAQFDEGKDVRGPVSMGVAVERGGALGVDVSLDPARLVVLGDSDFLNNGLLSGGAEELALHSVHWLLGEDELLAIPPKSVDEVRLMLNKESMRRLFFLAVLAIPSVSGLLGFLVYWRRRS